MTSWLERSLAALGAWLLKADLGLGLLLLVGLSFSLSHAFALLANRLTPRQILLRLLLDALVLTLVLLLSGILDMLLLAVLAQRPVQPTAFVNRMGAALIPGLFYILVAAPYISDLIALAIWFLVHLNVVTLLHVGFALPWTQALALSTPGFGVALALVALLFRQSWQASYRQLAGAVDAERPLTG
ncbi:MAG: hypothetical protein VKI83_07370 [Synechococcaceae cyanobacterium]|nr:hypothetical protein [Synechococcaceae cyanobacterium]